MVDWTLAPRMLCMSNEVYKMTNQRIFTPPPIYDRLIGALHKTAKGGDV